MIAETRDLGTRFAKIVVTDERGRYVIPDLPRANYRVWYAAMAWRIPIRCRRRWGRRSIGRQ